MGFYQNQQIKNSKNLLPLTPRYYFNKHPNSVALVIPTTTALCQPFSTLLYLHQLLNTTSFFLTHLIFLNSFLTIYYPLYLSHKQYLMSSFLTNPHTHKTHPISFIFPIHTPLGFTQIHFKSPQIHPNLIFLCALFWLTLIIL